MQSYILSVIVKFLLSKGLDYLDLPLDKIKLECEAFIRREIDPYWLEKVALTIFDGVWDLILGEVKKQLVKAPKGMLTYKQQEVTKCRSQATAAICKEMGIV